MIASPRTEYQEVPTIPIFHELSKLKSSSSNTVIFSGVDFPNQVEKNTSNSSSSSKTAMSIHSSSRNDSVKEITGFNLSHSATKAMRYFGSSKGGGADSEGLSLSQRELKDEDARLVYINDLKKPMRIFNNLQEIQSKLLNIPYSHSFQGICLNSFIELLMCIFS